LPEVELALSAGIVAVGRSRSGKHMEVTAIDRYVGRLDFQVDAAQRQGGSVERADAHLRGPALRPGANPDDSRSTPGLDAKHVCTGECRQEHEHSKANEHCLSTHGNPPPSP